MVFTFKFCKLLIFSNHCSKLAVKIINITNNISHVHPAFKEIDSLGIVLIPTVEFAMVTN